MACGCQGNSNKNPDGTVKEWLFVNPRGEQRSFRTEIEARAAQIRAGGGTIKTK
jgi:hypothetical protein